MTRWLWLSLAGLALAWWAMLALPGCGDGDDCDSWSSYGTCCTTDCSHDFTHCTTTCD